MAFETYLTHDKAKPKKSRRITYALSLGVHGLLLAIGVAGSYASVEELGPKTAFVPITFSVPPPPSGGPERKEPRRAKTPSKPRTLSKISQPIAQPTQQQAQERPGTGDPVVGGGGGGGGGDEGEGDGPPQDVFIPPNVSRGQLAIDPQSDRHRARLPAALARAGMTVSVLMKICVGRDGEVESVKVLRSDDATADANVVSAVRTWRYTPYKVDGHPVPFCTTVKYVLNSN